jgi:hypothetical protein
MITTPGHQTEQGSSTSTKTKAIQTPYDYHLLIQQLEEQGKSRCSPHFQVEDIDRPVILKLLAYFLRDEAVAANEGIDLHKGILLTGPIGCGKKSIMHLMKALPPEAYRPRMISCRDVSFEFSRIGHDIISLHSSKAYFPYTSIPKVHCYDDLGLEQILNYWGNSCNVMGEILLSRYDLMISNKMLTHVTTNLNSAELEAIYGNRLRSRMRAMFNLISFDPASRDKRK